MEEEEVDEVEVEEEAPKVTLTAEEQSAGELMMVLCGFYTAIKQNRWNRWNIFYIYLYMMIYDTGVIIYIIYTYIGMFLVFGLKQNLFGGMVVNILLVTPSRNETW